MNSSWGIEKYAQTFGADTSKEWSGLGLKVEVSVNI